MLDNIRGNTGGICTPKYASGEQETAPCSDRSGWRKFPFLRAGVMGDVVRKGPAGDRGEAGPTRGAPRGPSPVAPAGETYRGSL